MRIERQDVMTYGAPLLFVAAAFLAGSKRLIKHFPGASQKGLVCSTALGSAGVIASGLKNSGEGSDYDRRVYTIAGLAITAIAAPTLAKTLLGRADLNFRASLRFAFIQGLIFGVGDFGASFMDKADVIPPINPEPEIDVIPPIVPQSEADELPPQQQNHNENLPDEIEPEVDIPAAQEQNYIGVTPFDVLSIVFQFLSNADIAKTALTCKRFQEVVETPKIQMHLAESFAFGPRDWKRYFGDVGETPQLPDDIVDILKSPCPFWPDKRVVDTHMLLFIPRTVDGNAFTLSFLGEIIRAPKGEGESTWYRYIEGNTIAVELKEEAVSRSYWVLITKDILPESRNKTFDEQRRLLKRHYAIPRALEIATGILVHYVRSGRRLYIYCNITRCQETTNNNSRVVVGSFGPSGLEIGDDFSDKNYHGGYGGLSCVLRL